VTFRTSEALLGRRARQLLLASVAGTLLLLAMVGATWAVYVAASWLTSRIGATGSTRTVAKRFAHVLVPVGFAGMVAHSFTLILFEGQLVASTISDPFGLGWDLFGTAGRPIDYSLIQGPSETGWVWYVQVAVLLLGHVVALLLAHDRAMADGEGLAAVRSEYPMVAMLVASMSLGLFTVSAG